MEWINTKDRLPENNEWCIISYGYKVPVIACFKTKGWLDSSLEDLWPIEEILYWMPIPKYPKNEK